MAHIVHRRLAAAVVAAHLLQLALASSRHGRIVDDHDDAVRLAAGVAPEVVADDDQLLAAHQLLSGLLLLLSTECGRPMESDVVVRNDAADRRHRDGAQMVAFRNGRGRERPAGKLDGLAVQPELFVQPLLAQLVALQLHQVQPLAFVVYLHHLTVAGLAPEFVRDDDNVAGCIRGAAAKVLYCTNVSWFVWSFMHYSFHLSSKYGINYMPSTDLVLAAADDDAAVAVGAGCFFSTDLGAGTGGTVGTSAALVAGFRVACLGVASSH